MNSTITSLETLAMTGGISWGGTVLYLCVFVFFPLMLIGVGIAVLWNLANYTRFKKYLEWIVGSIHYAGIGVATLFTLSIPMGLIYYFYSQAKSGNTVPLIYGGYILLGYLGLVLLGWIVKKLVVKRIVKFETEIKEEKENEEVIDVTVGGK